MGISLERFDSEDEHRAHHRLWTNRVFAELGFAPFGLAGWDGERAMAWWGEGSSGITSVTLAFGRAGRTLVWVTTSRRALPGEPLSPGEPMDTLRRMLSDLELQNAAGFRLGMSLSGRVVSFTGLAAGGAWAALREGDGRGTDVVVGARDVKPTAVRLERVGKSQPYIDGFLPH